MTHHMITRSDNKRLKDVGWMISEIFLPSLDRFMNGWQSDHERAENTWEDKRIAPLMWVKGISQEKERCVTAWHLYDPSTLNYSTLRSYLISILISLVESITECYEIHSKSGVVITNDAFEKQLWDNRGIICTQMEASTVNSFYITPPLLIKGP